METYCDLYRQYYCITVGRYYTKEQKEMILKLLARCNGMDTDGKAFRNVLRSIAELEEREIRTLVESRNYRLILQIKGETSDEDAAVRELAACYEERERSGVRTYTSPADWRHSLYGERFKTDEHRKEIGYVEYVSGNVDEACAVWKQLGEEGDLLALKLLTVVSAEREDCENTFYYATLLSLIYTDRLRLEAESWSEELRLGAADVLPEERAAEIRANAEKKARQLVSASAVTKHVIGF